MKTLHFEGFAVNVPETRDESYGFTGDAPKKVQNMCKQLNKTKPIVGYKFVESEIIRETGAKFIEVI